jgi:chemotaxis protein methyltransferase CheR
MSGTETGPPLSAADLQQLTGYLYRRTGMVYGETKRYYIERRVAQRMAQSGSATIAGYLSLLLSSEAEAEQFINSFTVNETYFYREEEHLRCLTRSLLPDVIQRRGPGDLVRLWSLPCSTGEEPYSLAIWLLENWPLVDAYHIEIEGSDIDTRALADARVADYGERALARLPPDVVERYFEPRVNGNRRLIQDLRESVTLTKANLIDPVSMAARGRFDIIFCRNVLIYFDEASRQIAIQNLLAALQPGGFICLGQTETMLRQFPNIEFCRFEDATVYRRRTP